ncbi:MAG: PD-(D/E)XK nuclease family protein [Nitrospinaceae bacterium]
MTAPAASTPIYEWAGFQARCVGSVLHRCFQHLADQIEPDRANNSMEHWRPRLNTALAAMGLSGRDREDALDKSLRALENILADPQGRWVLSRHQEAMSEYSLTYQENGKIVTRIIDRTFVDEGVRWIIDYKTSEHGGGDLDQFFENEKKRYQGQLDNYAKVLQLMGENRPFRKALYNPLYRKFLEL